MTTRQQYYDAIARLEGYISAEFLRAVRDAVNSVSIVELEAAIKAGDIDRVLRILDVSDHIGSITANAIHKAFIDGIIIEGANLKFKPNIRSERAEQFLRERSSELITYITNEQMVSVRNVLTDAMGHGQAPRATALQLVGRVNKATGVRSGGIIGLNNPQSEYVRNARKELIELDSNYLTRTRRDKRFDLTVIRAIGSDTPLSSVDVQRITERYADRLLQLRGQTIARTESIAALNAGREESLNQAVISGDIPQQFVERIWDATMDARTRKDHVQMNGQKRSYGMPFTSPLGSMMMHPADSSLGASAADVVNCRCFERIRVDHIGIAKYKASLL